LAISYLRSVRARIRVKRNERLLNKFLNSFDNSDEFLEYIRKQFTRENRFHTYLSPTGSKETKRNSFKSIFEALHIDFKNASFLDFGPGYGESMEIAREEGAKTVEFVDYDPYIAAFNILRGFKGYLLDYIVGRGLTPLYPNKYNVILSKGSINADRVNRKEAGLIPFPNWLEQVENVAAQNGQIIICPAFDKGTETYRGSYYVCTDPEAFKRSWFSQVLQDKGYEIIYIENFNNPKRFSFTFYKKMS
jgi:hypothetical protein